MDSITRKALAKHVSEAHAHLEAIDAILEAQEEQAFRVPLASGIPVVTTNKSKPLYVIIVGHTARQSGAYSKFLDESEYAFNNKVANQMFIKRKNSLSLNTSFDLRVLSRDGRNISQTYEEARSLKPQAIVELHFNSFFTEQAKGMEALIAKQGPVHSATLAAMFLDQLKQDYHFRDRGIKRMTIGQRGYTSVSSGGDIPTALLEPFFGSSPIDSAKVRAKGRENGLASSYLQALMNFTNNQQGKQINV